MTTNDRGKRRKWALEETVAFLEAYLKRKEEFQHKRRKRIAYENVLRDLLTQGVLDKNTTAATLEVRMQTLMKMYRNGKYKRGFLQLIPYLKMIIGDMPGSSDSMEMSETMDPLDSNDVVEFEETIPKSQSINLGDEPAKHLEDDFVGGILRADRFDTESSIDIDIDIKEEMFSSSSVSSDAASVPRTSPQNSEEKYYAEKLQIYKESIERKAKQRQEYYNKILQAFERRFRESEVAKNRRHKERMDMYKRLLLK